MAYRKSALGLAAALAAVLLTAACTSGAANSADSSRSAARDASPAITAAQASQVWDHYVAVSSAQYTKSDDPGPTLALETGPELALDSATVKALDTDASSQRQALTGLAPPAYTAPAFYLPEQSGYPRFFVATVTRKLTSDYSTGAEAPVSVDGAEIHPFGPSMMLFERASAGAPWLLASISNLAVGETLPKLATDSAGYIPTVTPTASTLRVSPEFVGALQAAVVDDGPANAATKGIAEGQLTTGLYRGAADHASGLIAPRGDVYQWQLAPASFPVFALRTAAGGALVFYAMSLTTTVAVPDVINKANTIRSGPPIQVPPAVKTMLPIRSAPLVQLQSQETLTFAAVDPAPANAKVQVIALGGGLTSASAS